MSLNAIKAIYVDRADFQLVGDFEKKNISKIKLRNFCAKLVLNVCLGI